MNRLFTCILALLLPLLTYAQQSPIKHSIEIDASSFKPVNTDALTGVAIDKIEMDNSLRPCARIKLKVNRMTRADIEGLQVKVLGGIHDVMKKVVAHEGNGLIVELTAKPQTRFYLHHDKYGDSNEVTLNLEGNKEYRLDAELCQMQSIVVSSNVVGAEVYIDNEYKGKTNDSFNLTLSNIMAGSHKLRVKYNSSENEKEIFVTDTEIIFKVDVEIPDTKTHYVVFQVLPANALITINNHDYTTNEYGEKQISLNNGLYPYTVSAGDYHEEKGEILVKGENVVKRVVLRPAFGWLNVPNKGTLAGASVYVNGRLIGNAPLKSENLPSGIYDVRIVKDMYLTHNAKVEIRDNKITEHSPELVADFAHVTLTAAEDCDIYVNDEFKGRTRWSGDLATGTYIFEARKTNHNAASMSMNITPTPATQSYTLDAPTPIVGSLAILSTPAVADVYVDGKNVGSTPLNVSVIIGKHEVQIIKSGFKSEKHVVEVKKGAETELNTFLVSKELTGSPEAIKRKMAQAAAEKARAEQAAIAAAEREAARVAAEKARAEQAAVLAAKREQNRKKYSKNQSGYASMVDLSYAFACKHLDGIFGATYTAGYRFNNKLYLGAGAGINCNFGTSAILSGRRFDCNCLLPPSTVSFPLFAYFRANFANRRVSPFFALSAGGELSPKQTLKLDLYEIPYSAHSILIEPQLGLNIRTTTKSSLYLAVGLNNRIVPCCFSYTGYSAVLGYGYTAGVQLHFGFTF